MDCAVIPTKFPDLFTIQTTDFFYPSVDDPYLQGKIGCANVLSDLYAMGVVDCDNMLMLLGCSIEMPKKERNIITEQMIAGFNDLAKEAGTNVTGGQTVLNPWPIIGGVATSLCASKDFIRPENAVPGDVIVLTKPLGTQVAVNVNQWKYGPKWEEIKDILTKEEATHAYEIAMYSMARLNRTAAGLMHKYDAHGATDVTGFGIMGHGTNLVKNQKAALHFEIHSLPIIKKMKEVDAIKSFSLLKGSSAETSGGLLICLSEDNAKAFCEELEKIDGFPAWIIGRVIKSEEDRSKNSCTILKDAKIIEF